jgi:tellurite resistance protein
MKTNIKNLAAFLATSIWADGEYDEAEKIALSEIAETFELN